jgi:hypothetical protein
MSLSRPRSTALRLLLLLVPFGACFQTTSCTVATRGLGGGGGAAGGFAQAGRLPGVPGFGQPFVARTPILQPGGFAGSGGPP